MNYDRIQLGMQLLLMNANGSNETAVIPNGYIGIPFWSPDSSRIAALRDLQSEIFSVCWTARMTSRCSNSITSSPLIGVTTTLLQ